MQKLFGVLSLVRIHNCLIAGAGVWIGGYICSRTFYDSSIFLPALAIGLICGAGNAFNDYCDIEIDRINRPSRPLPSGVAPSWLAIFIFLTFNIFAVILASFCGIRILIPAIVYIAALLAYNLWLKRIAFVGNLLVAILGGGAFLVGGLAVCPESIGAVPGPLVPAIFAFLFHFGREILKDIADHRGDKEFGRKTVPEIMSLKWGMSIVASIYAVLIVLTVISVFYHWFHIGYAIVVLVFVDLPLAGLLGYLLISQSIDKYSLAGRYLKYLMIPGLIAFALS